MKALNKILSGLLSTTIIFTSINFSVMTVEASNLTDNPLGIVAEGNVIDASDTENLFGDSISVYSSPNYSSNFIATTSLDTSVALLASSTHNHFIADNSHTVQNAIYNQEFCIGKNGFVGRTYTLNFSSNRGSSSTKADSICTSASTKTGNLLFDRWKITSGSTSSAYPNNSYLSDCDGTSRAWNLTTTHNSTVTLTAQWHSATLDSFTDIYMPGYKFEGWYDSSSGGNKKTYITVSPAKTAFNQTLYAHWTPYQYKFAFDYNRPNENNYNPCTGVVFTHSSSSNVNKNGGSDTANFTFDGTFNNLPTPTLTGWTFKGWYLKVSDTVYKKIENGTVFNYSLINSNKGLLDSKHGTTISNPSDVAWTIVASWEPNIYTVRYLGNYNTSGQPYEEDWYYDVDYKINNNSTFTKFKREYSLSFEENEGSEVNDLINAHTFVDWLYYSTHTYSGQYVLYNQSDFNSCYNSSINHLDDTYEDVGIPYWGRTESDGDGTKASKEGMNYKLGTHFNEGDTVRNLSPVNGGVVELYAQWQINRVELPETEKLHYKFLSWYLQDQENSGNKGSKDDIIYKESTLLGNVGDFVYILQDTIAYAWYNQAPIFADIYEGQFFEGQNVSLADLLSLVSVYDYEDDYYNEAIKKIYNLPSVDQSSIYVPIHNDATITNEEVDGTINNDEIITIDGVPYRFNSDNWEKTSEEGIYRNIHTNELHYTIEKKMQLEEELNATNLVLKVKSIEYEYKDGVVQTIWDSDYRFDTNGDLAIVDGTQEAYTDEELSSYVLDTSTGRFPSSGLTPREDPYTAAKDAVGKFRITYQVTDNGVWNGNSLVDDNYYEDGDFTGHNPGGDGEDATTKISSAITLEYTRLCSIQYNNVPLIYLRDVMLYEGSEDWSSIIEKQIVIDAEDCINNPPFWYKSEEENTSGVEVKGGYTYDNLQDSLVEIGIWDCILDDAFLVDYPNAQNVLTEWEVGKTTSDLENLKTDTSMFGNSGATGAQIYSAILKFNVEFDAVDQWGKHSGGIITGDYLAGQYVGRPFEGRMWNATTEDYWQTQIERSITVYKVNTNIDNAMTSANVAEKVRYIDLSWMYTLSSNSYWGDSAYGKETLNKVLGVRENASGLSKKSYSTVATNKNGDSINVTIDDYTNN